MTPLHIPTYAVKVPLWHVRRQREGALFEAYGSVNADLRGEAWRSAVAGSNELFFFHPRASQPCVARHASGTAIRRTGLSLSSCLHLEFDRLIEDRTLPASPTLPSIGGVVASIILLFHSFASCPKHSDHCGVVQTVIGEDRGRNVRSR